MLPLAPKLATLAVATVAAFTTVLSAPASADDTGDPIWETVAEVQDRADDRCVYVEIFEWHPEYGMTVDFCRP